MTPGKQTWLAGIALAAMMAAAPQATAQSLLDRLKRAAESALAAPPARNTNQPERTEDPTGVEAATGQPGDAAADIRQLERMFGNRFHPTRFPGLYQMQVSDPDVSAVLMTRNAELTVGNGLGGMRHGSDGPAFDRAQTEAALRPLLPYLGVERWFQFGGNGPLRVVLLSAIDCPYCRDLEADLGAAGVRYAALPNAIMHENMSAVRDVYCSSDPSAAWEVALEHGQVPVASPACEFEADHFKVVASLLGGRTPAVLYADGTLGRPEVGSIQAKVAELEKAGLAF